MATTGRQSKNCCLVFFASMAFLSTDRCGRLSAANTRPLAACKTLASAGWLAAAVRCAVARSAAFRVQAWLVRGVHCDCWLSTIAAARSCALRRVVLLVLKGI